MKHLMLIFSLIFATNVFAANTLQVGQTARIQSVSANYQILKDDDIVNVDASAAARTATLPAVSTSKAKTVMVIKSDTSSNTVSVAGFGGGTFIINCGQCFVEAFNNGTAWIIKSTRNAPTVQRFLSGSGTYNRPFGVVSLRVKMVGGGGGSAGSGTSGTGGVGGNGGTSTFGSSLLIATGGTGGQTSGSGSAGGTGTINAPAIGSTFSGSFSGHASYSASTATYLPGGYGGHSMFGGGGGAGNQSTGNAGTPNTGGGGGGPGTNAINSIWGGSGGGGAGGVDALIPSPAASYPYSVGAAGTAGAAGTSGSVGTIGGLGVITVEENYQ